MPEKRDVRSSPVCLSHAVVPPSCHLWGTSYHWLPLSFNILCSCTVIEMVAYFFRHFYRYLLLCFPCHTQSTLNSTRHMCNPIPPPPHSNHLCRMVPHSLCFQLKRHFPTRMVRDAWLQARATESGGGAAKEEEKEVTKDLNVFHFVCLFFLHLVYWSLSLTISFIELLKKKTSIK